MGTAVRLVDVFGDRDSDLVFQDSTELDFVEEDVAGEAVGEFEDQVVVDLKDTVGAAAQEADGGHFQVGEAGLEDLLVSKLQS